MPWLMQLQLAAGGVFYQGILLRLCCGPSAVATSYRSQIALLLQLMSRYIGSGACLYRQVGPRIGKLWRFGSRSRTIQSLVHTARRHTTTIKIGGLDQRRFGSAQKRLSRRFFGGWD